MLNGIDFEGHLSFFYLLAQDEDAKNENLFICVKFFWFAAVVVIYSPNMLFKTKTRSSRKDFLLLEGDTKTYVFT